MYSNVCLWYKTRKTLSKQHNNKSQGLKKGIKPQVTDRKKVMKMGAEMSGIQTKRRTQRRADLVKN